ncbi:MAG TPA: M28 family peptidase [Myxococcota bacterium]
MKFRTAAYAGASIVLALTLGGSPATPADTPPLGQGSTAGLSPQEVALLGSLDTDHAMMQLAHISGLGEKVAGDAAERGAQQYVYDTLSAMPLDDVVMETFPTTSWGHEGDVVRIVGPAQETLPASIYGYAYGIWGKWFGKPYSFGNRNGGRLLRAPVVDVGYGTAAEFAAVGDLKGAIALVRRDDNLQAWPNTMTEEAALHGASAVINYGYYGDIVHPEGIKQDVSGGPLPEFAISKNSAARIQNLLQSGPVVLELEGRAYAVTQDVGESVNVAGYLRGTKYPDEYVIFAGHIDCWWVGTSDDSSSIAAVLEFARTFSEARAAGLFENERTLVFLSVGAEEFGGPWDTWYDWLIGSYEYVVAHEDIMRGLVVELNMDGVSFKKTTGQYWVENTWEINGFINNAIKAIGKTGQISLYNPIWSWTDAWSFGAKAGGSTAQSWWVSGFDSIYHTQLDNMDRAHVEPIRNILQLYTLLGMRAANAVVVPLDFTPTVGWAASALDAEAFAVPYLPDAFADAKGALDALSAAAAAANARAAELKSAYAMASDEQKPAIRSQADALNDSVIAARRIINRWTLGEGGTMGSWDVFLRSDQHVHDLAQIDAALAALSRGRGQVHTALAALEKVYTMEWGRLFSPENYHSVVDWMISDSMYWGDDFDQQQAYVDVHDIHRRLKAGSPSLPDAIAELQAIRQTQLIPWLLEDLEALGTAWREAAGILANGG